MVLMEPLRGPKAEIRHIVKKHLEDFEHRLTGELTEKLTERERSYVWWRHRRCGLIAPNFHR